MANHRFSLHTNKGFTLIEMMVVVGMISILCAISYPSVSGMVQKYQFRAAAFEMLMAASQAKSNAVKDNGVWKVTLGDVDGADPSHKFILKNPDNEPVPPPPAPAYNLSNHGNGISFIATGSGKSCGGATGLTQAATISFDGRGFGNDIGSFYIQEVNTVDCFRVVVSKNGLIRMGHFNGTVWK